MAKAKKTASPTAIDKVRSTLSYSLRTLADDVDAGRINAVVLGCVTKPGCRASEPDPNEVNSPDAGSTIGHCVSCDLSRDEPQQVSELTVGLVARLASKVKFGGGLFG